MGSLESLLPEIILQREPFNPFSYRENPLVVLPPEIPVSEVVLIGADDP